MEKTKFTFWEMVFFLTNSICFKLFLLYSTLAAREAKSATILLTLVSGGVAAIIFWIISILYKKFHHKNVLNLIQESFGKFTSGLFAIIFIIFFIASAGVHLRQIVEAIITVILPSAPENFVYILLVGTAILGAFVGLRALIRSHVIFVPLIMSAVVLVFFASIQTFDFSNIYPLLGDGINGLSKSVLFSSFLVDIVMILFLMPNVQEGVSFKKIGFSVIGICTFFAVLINGAYLLTVPYPINTEYFLPVFQLERFVTYSIPALKFGSLFAIFWCISFYLYISSMLSFCSNLGSRLIKHGKHRWFILPFALIMLIIAKLPYSLSDTLQYTQNLGSMRFAIGFVLLPLVLLILRIKKRGDTIEKK